MRLLRFLSVRVVARTVVLSLFLSSGLSAAAAERLVRSQDEFRRVADRLRAGDSVVLADGEWRDFEVLFGGKGRPGKPITLRPQTPGGAVLTGRSNLRLAGEHLVVSGLVFRDGHTPTSTVISFRHGRGKYANHSRVTNTVIDHFNNPERFEQDHWVMLYGRHNRFDHNHLAGKSNKGVTMAVRLDDEASRQNHHRIDHNYFGPRPLLGSNGGETLRIGTSHFSLTDSFTVVENNWFDRCSGEVEIISSKSGGNVFRGNLFTASQGTLTLRHGNGNLVEDNVFLGGGAPHTGGIRVINKRQIVRNNYMENLTGHRFGAALVIMNGVPDSPINRYHQVEDSVVENNSIVNSAHIELAAGADAERSAPPRSSTFARNFIYNADGRDIFSVHDDVSGIRFADNVQHGVAEPGVAGVRGTDVEVTRAANGLLYPLDAGVDAGVERTLQVLDRSATGVAWYPKPGPLQVFDGGRQLRVAKAAGGLRQAVAEAAAGDVLELGGGDHVVEQVLVIERPLTIRSARAGRRARLLFERSALFEIRDGGSLKLVGLDVSGRNAPDAAGNAVIRTGRYSMLNNFWLHIEDVTVEQLDINHSFDFFRLAPHTFAEQIRIVGSRFSGITGDVLDLYKEYEDLGIYNAEYVQIIDSSFTNIAGAVASVYRGGTDESTFGPHFEMRGSTLSGVGAGRRNKSAASVFLHGVQDVDIQGNVLEESRPLRIVRTVGEPVIGLAGNRHAATPPPDIGDH